MKKTLLNLFAGVLIAGTASAQCTFDSQYSSAPGNFFPDSATFIAEQYATTGMAYAGTVSIRTISDTLVENPVTPGSYITAYIDAFKIESVTGQPAGFTYQGGGGGWDGTQWNNGGSGTNTTPVEGCLSFSASASDVTAAAPLTGYTDYPVAVLVDARISGTDPNISFLVPNGTWISSLSSLGLGSLPVDDYVLRVYGTTGISETLNPNVFQVHQSYPNPAGNEATITFTNPRVEEVELKIFNMLGAVVYNETVVSEAGVNDIKLNTGRMSAGLYVYTVSNGTKTFTQKMTVK
ncbi:MAG: T9SS type A sorting domain-containing protein [Flavobacteriales bacterium]|nr:T9SS type A sorting domain-containing protein [Flavobacteriales bacterium]